MDIRDRKISSKSKLLDALKRMDKIDKKLLIVFDAEEFVGLISAGDIQRAIIGNIGLEVEVGSIIREDCRYATTEMPYTEIRSLMIDFRMELCPVIDANGKLDRFYYWEDLFEPIEEPKKRQFNIPVVIMAGGFGTRLKPLTNVLPKPLIPIGEKTMLEEIMDRFHRHGCDNFLISVNYKADLIDFYLNSQSLPYNTHCYVEEKPLGTAGSLHLLKDRVRETFFVTNCDILIEDDYSEIIDYHREHENEITLVAALKHFPISYGILETVEGGQLTGIEEKPELTFKINSGMYILEPHLLHEIPEDSLFHITQLIENVMARKGRIGVFPVSEKSWKDMGEVGEIRKFYSK